MFEISSNYILILDSKAISRNFALLIFIYDRINKIRRLIVDLLYIILQYYYSRFIYRYT